MKKYFLACIAFLSILVACKKPISHQTLLAVQDFPTTIGSWWFYQDGSETDTIKILDTITLQNINCQRWVQINSVNPNNDTMYVVVGDSSIKFCNSYPIYGPYLTINFPIIENTVWGPPLQATNYSAGLQNITVNNVAYNGATYLNQTIPPSQGASLNESIWIVKNIGIVQHYISGGGLTTHNYELISYHIN